jgi:hypothetical protein
MIATIDYQLKSSPRRRQTLTSFEQDWTLMLHLIEKESAARNQGVELAAARRRGRFLEAPERLSFKRRFQKVFIMLTH